jgi:hypothetical protein
MGWPIESSPPEALNCDTSADVELAFCKLCRRLGRPGEAQRFYVEEFFDGERVVQFDDVEIRSGNSGVGECGVCGLTR